MLPYDIFHEVEGCVEVHANLSFDDISIILSPFPIAFICYKESVIILYMRIPTPRELGRQDMWSYLSSFLLPWFSLV